MKTLLTLSVVSMFALGAGLAHATGGCHSACAEGYTYSAETKSCVPKTVSS